MKKKSLLGIIIVISLVLYLSIMKSNKKVIIEDLQNIAVKATLDYPSPQKETEDIEKLQAIFECLEELEFKTKNSFEQRDGGWHLLIYDKENQIIVDLMNNQAKINGNNYNVSRDLHEKLISILS